MHLCFVPLTEDGRLSAKDIMGNKKKLTWWQDEFWKHMVKKFPDLERGESASLTGRDHIPVPYTHLGFTDGIEHPLIGAALHFHLSESRTKKVEGEAMDSLRGKLPWWF